MTGLHLLCFAEDPALCWKNSTCRFHHCPRHVNAEVLTREPIRLDSHSIPRTRSLAFPPTIRHHVPVTSMPAPPTSRERLPRSTPHVLVLPHIVLGLGQDHFIFISFFILLFSVRLLPLDGTPFFSS